MAASSAISADATTATTVTNRLFLRKFQYGSPMTLPSITVLKLDRVGWLGNGCGVRVYHSVSGLNAVDTIQKIGNRVISATSSPSRFSPIRRVRRVQNRRRDLATAGPEGRAARADRIVMTAPPP